MLLSYTIGGVTVNVLNEILAKVKMGYAPYGLSYIITLTIMVKYSVFEIHGVDFSL